MADTNVDAAIAAARGKFRQGFVPRRGRYFAGPMCGCLVGAAAAAAGYAPGALENGLSAEKFAKSHFGLTQAELTDLVGGFDGEKLYCDPKSYAYGQAAGLAAEVLGGPRP